MMEYRRKHLHKINSELVDRPEEMGRGRFVMIETLSSRPNSNQLMSSEDDQPEVEILSPKIPRKTIASGRKQKFEV